jgi:hypothetical protein
MAGEFGAAQQRHETREHGAARAGDHRFGLRPPRAGPALGGIGGSRSVKLVLEKTDMKKSHEQRRT